MSSRRNLPDAEDVDDFLKKVTDVEAQLKGLVDGSLAPSDVVDQATFLPRFAPVASVAEGDDDAAGDARAAAFLERVRHAVSGGKTS